MPDERVPETTRPLDPRELPTKGAAELPARPPRRWGPLTLIQKIGEGAFGETFRAHDPWLDREVALKLLKGTRSDPQRIERRVIQEGVLLARVSHPNVVTVYGAERHENRVGMWMELIRGATLSQVLRSRGMLDEHALRLVGLDLSRALAAVHAAGIIHRDIKCENVMREDGGRIVLMDFGAGLEVEGRRAKGGSLTGTPLYMAPELLRREPATVRTDLYSVGVLLYHLATDQYPAIARSLRELHEIHAQDRATPLSEYRGDLPDGLVEIIEKCLEQEPADRYQTAGALERALARTGETGSDSAAAVRSRADFTAWRHARIAEWSRPRYRLDKDFVALSLLVDEGETALSGRWSARPERYRDLGELLAAAEDPAFVLLGPPGCGKSTLLRRFELDTAEAALREGGADAVTFFLQLNHYKPPRPGDAFPEPEAWLVDRWHARFPELPALDELFVEKRVILLLDGLNEIPTPSSRHFHEAIVAWKEFLERLVEEHPGNRVVFSCRALDYSAPLSSSRLRVPQIVIEPMADHQVEQYLVKHAPELGAKIWSELAGTQQLEVMRSPYFLSLLVSQVETADETPRGRAGLFTGFIRQALRRELERDNPLFAPDGLLSDRDVRRVTRWFWRTPWELPERGVLVPKLSGLAFAMQDGCADGGTSQVRVGFDRVLELLADEQNEDIVRAGVALSVLDEDAANDEVLFFHQIIQEYFAGRKLGKSPDPERVRVPWRAREIKPPLREVLASLPAGETLPGLVRTGWEETALFAGAMAAEPDGFLRGLMESNLALAGECASQLEVRERIAPELISSLRNALLARSRDKEADLRARIEAGLALGRLGDPRMRRVPGAHGPYVLPPLVEIPGGRYPIGEDEPIDWLGHEIRSHIPRHEVEIAPFRLGRFSVTNAEWAFFQGSGSYESMRWWDTEAARRWLSGEGTADDVRTEKRHFRRKFLDDPALLETIFEKGQVEQESYERWKRWLVMTDAEFEADLQKVLPGGKFREAKYWRDPAYNNPAQPVVGICWYEARAYCNWLSAQSGEPLRLPSEVELEAAARGRAGRLFAYGDEFDSLKGNTAETRLRRTTPVGIFPEGETPEGIADLAGNVAGWTLSLFGPGTEFREAPFAYPYRAEDGRENVTAGSEVRRVLRGGAWNGTWVDARAAYRNELPTTDRNSNGVGFRLAGAV